jgi:ubiquinone/menaquinone biosynthesis C-methylase UbiE
MVERVAHETKQSTLSLLEVAAGSGYVPETARQRLQQRGLDLQVTVLDRAPSHLSNGQPAVAGDALALPFRDASFDLLSCSLFAHHLSPQELVRFVDEGLRVCRLAVLINDLVRHTLHLSLVYAGMPLYRSRITRHDAPASVRQAYTPEEMKTLIARSSAARIEIQRHYLFRMGVIAWKH